MKGSQRGSKLSTAKERIKAYLVGDDIILSAEELKILSRWEKADLLHRQGQMMQEIIEALTGGDDPVSRFTAQNDLFAAMEVFAAARKINKKYLIFLKYQRQEQDIINYRKSIFFEIDEKTNKEVPRKATEKEVMALAKLEEAATYTLNSIPQEQDKAAFVPTRVMLHLVDDDQIPMELSLTDTLKLADAYIKTLPLLDVTPIEISNGAGKQSI